MAIANFTEGTVTKPVIFNISAAWDHEASVWCGHCDAIPAAADSPTLDGLLAKISAMALDLLPDNHPGEGDKIKHAIFDVIAFSRAFSREKVADRFR